MEIQYYKLNELEALLRVTKRTLYNWIKSGKLEAVKVGHEWRVTKEALEAFTQLGTK